MSPREVVISTWRDLGEPPLGGQELRAIERAVTETFGQREAMSPASIARILADEDAELCHPEIIELDARWRESQIELELKKFKTLGSWSPGNQLHLSQAEPLIKKFEHLRGRFERSGDDVALRQLRTLAIDARRLATSKARSKSATEPERAEQAEIAEWFGIWLQTPALFEQWLDLRKSSSDFKQKFL